jgi:hypothetical protein
MRLSRRTKSLALVARLLIVLSGCSSSRSPSPIARPIASARYNAPYDLSSTVAVAVYEYLYKYADLGGSAIQFTLNAPQELRAVVDGVDMDPSHALDGTGLGTEPSAYVYARNAAGAIHQYRVVLNWGYLLDGNDWKALRRISATAATALRSRVKE